MRLIDADLLTKNVTKWLNSDPNADRMADMDDIAASVLMEIEEQPTVHLWVPVEDRMILHVLGRKSLGRSTDVLPVRRGVRVWILERYI